MFVCSVHTNIIITYHSLINDTFEEFELNGTNDMILKTIIYNTV